MMLAGQWLYRARQYARAWAGALGASELQEVAGLLSPPLLELYLGMGGPARRHGYDVYRTLKARGWQDPDLLSAALLHDVGKGDLGLLPRVLWVLLGAWSRGLRARLARHPFWGRGLGLRASLLHPELGAELVHRAGGSLITVWLVRQHELWGHRDPVLRALQRADNDN